jgi:DNA-directed RNA polymerase subunit RPC12/RpoP
VSDLLYRCEHCGTPVTSAHIQTGGCVRCGGRRLKVAVCIDEKEIEWLKTEGYELNPEQWCDEATQIEKRKLERAVR